jgi:hypothetical protein
VIDPIRQAPDLLRSNELRKYTKSTLILECGKKIPAEITPKNSKKLAKRERAATLTI